MKIFKAFLFFSFLIFGIQVRAQKKEYCFKQITTNNGLSHSYVPAIVQDRDGFMWFGTQEGLSKYDGDKFTIYRHDPKNPASISHNYIRALLLDQKGDLWIGTNGGGLSYFQKEKNCFINYLSDPSDSNAISNNMVRSIVEDANEKLWIGTNGGGLNCFDKRTHKFIRLLHKDNDIKSIGSNVIWDLLIDKNKTLWIATRDHGLDKMINNTTFKHYEHATDSASISTNVLSCIYEDNSGSIWVGTEGGGLNRLNTNGTGFIRYSTSQKGLYNICHNDILTIEEDAKGNIWIGTENGGISILSKNQKTSIHLQVEDKKEGSLNNNSIHSLHKDIKGNMWVGTYSGGVNFLSAEPENFIHYKHNVFNPNSLNNNNVLSIQFINPANLLIGTDGGGLNLLNLKTNEYTFFTHTKNPFSISSDYVLSVFQDAQKDIWTGTYKGGLGLFNENKGTFYNFKVDGSVKGCVDPSIGKIIQDRNGNIWIANYGQGISLYDKKNKLFTHYLAKPEGNISVGVVFTITEDHQGNIWAGTEGGGLNKLHPADQSISEYRHSEKNSSSLSNDIVNFIFEDSEKHLWIGTNSGLNLFNPEKQSFIGFFVKDGLPDNTILGILEDNHKNLWISTNRGLSKYNLSTRQFKNFTLSDGLQGNSFNRNSCYKGPDGSMFFGGLNGFNVFHPDSIFQDLSFPPVYITDFKIFNNSIVVGAKDSILKRNLRFTKEIAIDYAQSFFSLNFTALNYSHPERIKYAYKLEGFDKDWIYIGNNKGATYTNLNPGTYTFNVKASSEGGTWGNNIKTIQLLIRPPFYMTWWFKLLMAIIFIVILLIIYSIRTMNIRKTNKWLTVEVQTRTSEINNQKEEILSQKQHIEEKNTKLSLIHKDMQDSLQYAKTIQEAMMQDLETIKSEVSDCFILLKPCEIVSGDFYWCSKKAGKIILAAVDCTGHGVPGALLSMVANNLLNQIVITEGITEADKILYELNLRLKLSLKQNENGNRDGMDIALCIIDKEQHTLEYAGAVNPLYYIQHNTFNTIKGDSVSIGGNSTSRASLFKKHIIDISVPTTFYIGSDGFEDQNGGPENKKFMKSNLRDLLFEISEGPMENQKIILEKPIQDWMGDKSQRDDIMVIGVRIGCLFNLPGDINAVI